TRSASEVLPPHDVLGATDVTGFGLLGHGLEMARGSGARFVFEAAALPALPGALDLAREGVETGGAAHNRRFVRDDLAVAPDIEPALVTLAHDPQTSGGLLAAVPEAATHALLEDLAAAGVSGWRVGHVESGGGVELRQTRPPSEAAEPRPRAGDRRRQRDQHGRHVLQEERVERVVGHPLSFGARGEDLEGAPHAGDREGAPHEPPPHDAGDPDRQDARASLDADRPVEGLSDQGAGEEPDDDHEPAVLRAEIADGRAECTGDQRADGDLTRTHRREGVPRRLSACLAAQADWPLHRAAHADRLVATATANPRLSLRMAVAVERRRLGDIGGDGGRHRSPVGGSMRRVRPDRGSVKGTVGPYLGTGSVSVRRTLGRSTPAGGLPRRARPYVRLTQPLVRDTKGGDLRPASWDEALDRVVAGFQAAKAAHGPTTFGTFSCSKATNEVNYAAQKFSRAVLGSNNIDSCNRT